MHNTAHAWLCGVLLLLLIVVPAGDESKPQDDNLVGTPHYMSVAAIRNTPASSADSQAAASRVVSTAHNVLLQQVWVWVGGSSGCCVCLPPTQGAPVPLCLQVT